MHNFRWKWIGYYTFSNLLIAAGCCILMWIALQVLDIEIAAVEYLAYAAAICLAAVGLAAVLAICIPNAFTAGFLRSPTA